MASFCIYCETALVEIEFTQRASLVRSLLRLAQRFLESLVEQLMLILFRFDRLPENFFVALILLAHGLGSGFKIFEGTLARRGCVGKDRPGLGIDLQDRPAIGTGDFKRLADLAFMAANILEHSTVTCPSAVVLDPDGFVAGTLLSGLLHQNFGRPSP